MKFFLLVIALLALFFSSCGSLFGPSSNAGFDIREYDVDIEGPFLFTNGQKLVLSEKCYYKGSGNYECGLAALGLVTSTSNVSHRPDGSSGSVHRYHNGTMDFSNVKVRTRNDSTHGILSYASDRSYSGRNDFPLHYKTSIVFFDDMDMLKDAKKTMEDEMLILADSSGVVDVEIEDSEKNIVHLVYKMFLPEVMDSMSYEDGGFTLNHEKIELILDYCYFTKDSMVVSDSLLQVCLNACLFCDGMYPLFRQREDYIKGEVDFYQSYYDGEEIEYPHRNISDWIHIGVDWVPYAYYKP